MSVVAGSVPAVLAELQGRTVTIGERRPKPRHRLLERARDSDQAIMKLGVVSVDREGDLAEARIEARSQEARVGKHPSVGDGLDLVEAELPPQPNELDVARVQARLATVDVEQLQGFDADTFASPGEPIRVDWVRVWSE